MLTNNQVRRVCEEMQRRDTRAEPKLGGDMQIEDYEAQVRSVLAAMEAAGIRVEKKKP